MTPEEEEAIRREFEASRKQGHAAPQHQGPTQFQTNEYSNIKLTTPVDITVAEALLAKRNKA